MSAPTNSPATRLPKSGLSDRRGGFQTRPYGVASKRLHQIVGARHFGFARSIFDIERLHHAVLDDHRITLRANAEAALGQVRGQAQSLGPVAAAVGEKFDGVAAGSLFPGVH